MSDDETGIECAILRPGPAPCACPYHMFLKARPDCKHTVIPEVERRYRLSVALQGSSSQGMTRIDELPSLERKTFGLAETRISQFLGVLDYLYQFPGSNLVHLPNRAMVQRFASAFLKLIVGEKEARINGEAARGMLTSSERLTPSNVCWVTNRQQVTRTLAQGH